MPRGRGSRSFARWAVHAPEGDAERGGILTLGVPRGPEALRELLRREVLVDCRPRAGIRVSPHFYNAEEEVDRVVAGIAHILRQGHAMACP